MIISNLPKFIFSFSLLILIMTIELKPTLSHQSYDNTDCFSLSHAPGSKYSCTSGTLECDAFIAYRAQTNFDTIRDISSLFGLNQTDVASINNNNIGDPSIRIEHGREVLMPIACHCHGGFSRAIIRYNFSSNDSFANVACGVFEGLAKAQTLFEENPSFRVNGTFDRHVDVPIRCACPDADQRSKGVNYLVTYPIMGNDNTSLIARMFSVSEEMTMDANKLRMYEAIFPGTTILVPTRDVPTMNWSNDTPFTSPPSPRPVSPLRKTVGRDESAGWHSIIYLGVGASMSVLVIITLAIVCIKMKLCRTRYRHFSTVLPLPEVSPEFLVCLSKLKQSLICYSLEELRIATGNFNEGSIIGSGVFKGRLGASFLAIEQMEDDEAACQVVYILTKINHYNIVKLQGWCAGTKPFLVYELAENGSLRHCLSTAELCKKLTWARRKQIAIDVAAALQYLHCCTTPSFIHRNVNSSNVLITADWRAKICGFSLAKQLDDDPREQKETNWNESVIVGLEGYLSPEYVTEGQASLKLDVYAFGIVLLELLSGREVVADGKLIKDSINFEFNGRTEGSSDCFEKLTMFMDPFLERDYPSGDAMMMVLLVKACISEKSHRRPTMSNVLNTLSRIV